MTDLTPQKLPALPYDFDALEPFISAEIMKLHYEKHHQTYVNNLNAALEKYENAAVKGDFAQMIELEKAIRFNGGGHINHSIFWTNLAPKNAGGGILKEGAFKTALEKNFGSFENFKTLFATKTVAIQGSGWGWLGWNKERGLLEIATQDNQDPLLLKGLVPLLGFDVWEHAYYLQYKNVRADYVKSLFEIVNWDNVETRWNNAK